MKIDIYVDNQRTGGILGRFCLRAAQANAFFFYKRLIFIAEGVWEKNNFREAKIASWDEIG